MLLLGNSSLPERTALVEEGGPVLSEAAVSGLLGLRPILLVAGVVNH